MAFPPRVFLLNPPWDPSIGYGKALSKMTFVFPPIGLMSLASYVRREDGAEVVIYDAAVDSKPVLDAIAHFKPDIIGITAQTSQLPSVFKLAPEIKQAFPDIPIIVGGSHPSVRPHEVAAHPSIDAVVIGEGEETLSDLLHYCRGEKTLDSIPGIGFRQGEKVILTVERPLLRDLSTLPMPAVDLINLSNYRCSPDNQIGDKTVLMSTSRGCPFKCTFCAIKDKFASRHRVRSMESIIAELDYYVSQGVDSLFLIDDIFTINRKRVFEFCDLLISRKYNLKWWAQTRADCINPEMLKKMKDAGCSILSFGIESGSNRLLDEIKKQVTTKEIREAVKMARRTGIRTRGSFILGLPGETLLESLRTIWFGFTLPLHRAKFGLLVPYPGTAIWDQALTEGQVKENGEDWLRFSPMWGYTDLPPSYIPVGRNPELLRVLQRVANFLFYLKPSVIWDIVNYYHENKMWGSLGEAVVNFLQATFKIGWAGQEKRNPP